MTTVSIDTLWQLIRESDQSHGIQFVDDGLLVTTAVTAGLLSRSEQSSPMIISRWRMQRAVRGFRHLLDGDFEFPS
jgi:hypothetical protein